MRSSRRSVSLSVISGCRALLSLALLATSFVASIASHAETATAIGNSRSLQMGVATGYNPAVGNVYTYVTTFDGAPGVTLYDLTPDGYAIFSYEMRPRSGVPGTYEADFVTFDDFDDIIDYGSFTAHFPTTDNDGNGLPDILQTNKPGSTTISGTVRSDAYQQNGTISGSLSRQANSNTGTYLVTVSSQQTAPINYTGALFLYSFSGTIDYSRDSGLMTLSLTEALPSGGSRTITGETTFVVASVNQIAVPQFNVTTSDGYTFTAQTTTFNRAGNRYVANIALVDGLPETHWPDFVNWVIEITDPNDSNGNGIPNLSDQQPTPTPTPTATPSPTPVTTPTPSATPIPTPAATPTISIRVSPGSVAEGGDAVFTVSASTINPSQVTTVRYSVSGKAQFQNDYTVDGLFGQIDIPVGASSATVMLHVIADGLKEKKEKLTMTLLAGAGYKLAKQKKASVTIQPSP